MTDASGADASGAEAPVTDEELTVLALAASLDDPIDPDARSFFELTEQPPEHLPAWYMPSAPGGGCRLTGWRRRVAWTLVIGFLAINAAGLCSTYGSVVPAW